MISLLSPGDTDILRDAVRPSTVFWYRVRTRPRLTLSLAGLTLVLLLTFVLMLWGVNLGLAWATRERVAVAFAPLLVGWMIYTGWVIFKLMPGRNDRVVINLRNFVRSRIDPLEERIAKLSDDELRAKRREFEERLRRGESLDDIRPEVYACVREASKRARKHRHFECQLIGGKVIEDCKVAEMRTGEGKTIVCYTANFMKVLQGKKVHMVTVNDYLVKRDAEFCRPIFDLLGVTVGYITSDMETYGPEARVRQEAYRCDITYGTNNEFGFDYLRDNMKIDPSDLAQGPLDFAVIDEVDSILIDEARTPLIISGPAHDDVRNYQIADNIARSLINKQEQANRETRRRLDEIEATAPKEVREDPKFRDGIKKFRADPFWLSSDEAEAIGHMQYFVVEMDRKSAHMTEHGAKAAQAELGIGTFYDSRNMNWPHYIDNALRAHLCYHKDKEYVVQDGAVIIVDEFTGRLMHGRQWSDGLHQAVEAKERLQIKQQTQTLATITLQNLFKLYGELAGMTGTAMTEAEEFMKIYKLEVIAIPTNKPVRRIDYNDKLYKTLDNKFDAIVEEIRSYSQNGYPADPWSLYDMLREAQKLLRQKLRHQRDEELQQQLQVVEEALRAFDDGRGEPEVLEQAYLKLAGGNVGGRPVLVGTVSVESSEKLSQALTRRYGIEHEVLNAKNHAREAEIVAKAGQQHEETRGKKKRMVGNVTIATNMAGRGTDIVLGPGVARIGGLHVVGTERHESRRIDNQLRGRCGRQGDPGSSRFFLSLEDDLLRLFMGEWVLKMLAKYAVQEGVPIEHRQLTKGIERAQKKVEERNFNIRKNLLEYDEVPDQQRRTFYAMRRRVLLGQNLSEFIWEMIDQTVADAVDRYYDPRYPAQCVAEWVANHLGVQIDVDKLDTDDLHVLTEQVRDLAIAEVHGHVQRTFGEYIEPDAPPDEWDIRGLTQWVAQYGLSYTQRQVRETDPHDLMDEIAEAAIRRVEEADLSPLATFVDPVYPRKRLIAWAHDKFGVRLPEDKLAQATRDEAEQIIGEQMRAAYRRREVEYPAMAVVEFAVRTAGTNRVAACEQIAHWTNLKFRLGWTYEHFVDKEPQQIFEELCDLNRTWLQNGRLDNEVDEALKRMQDPEQIVAWARERFGRVVETVGLEPGPDLREQLKRCGYEMLRYELTQLERIVLLRTMDAAWKDHMYSMDLLRHSIGLRGYAERDPKIEFKREGTRMFNELLSNIRERVTDLIFKVGLGPEGFEGFGGVGAAAAPAAAAVPQMTVSHADATGAGFRTAAEGQQRQGEGARPRTIRREKPKIGRNDPCPCGSGKKYKHCCGKVR